MKVIVVGGGLAGLTAALQLAEAGVCVRVYEAEPVLGGKAASWTDASGDLVETGLHVCFPYYDHFLKLLRRVGAEHTIRWRATEFAYIARGATHVLRFPRLPAPLHGVAAIAGFEGLPLRARLSTGLGAAEATLAPQSWLDRYEDRTFADWASQRGLSPSVVEVIFEPMVRGLTFLTSAQVSARAMLDYVHRIGARADVCRVGLFREGLTDAIMRPLQAAIERAGGQVHVGEPVRGLEVEAGHVRGVALESGARVDADAVVVAVPSHQLGRLWPSSSPPPTELEAAAKLTPAPVASAMLWLDRRVPGPPGVRFSSGTVFNTWADMTELIDALGSAGGSVLQLVIAPMATLQRLDDGAIVARVWRELCELMPALAQATVRKAVLTRLDASVYAVVPGAQAYRPTARTSVGGLFLAGDYTATGHNPNMEGAVRSGEVAARLVRQASL